MELLLLPLDEREERWNLDWARALDEGERARADRFRRPADRTRHLAAHALLRAALGAATGRAPAALALARGTHGKPFLPGAPGLHFSLTHTDGLVACALHDAPVGCDAEPADRRADPAVFPLLAPEERRWLERQPTADGARDAAFLRLWVAKEAFSKALGLGLSLDLASYALDLSSGDGVRLRRPPPGCGAAEGWRLGLAEAGPRHLLALAAQGAAPARTAGPPLARPRRVRPDALARAASAAHRDTPEPPSAWT